MQNRSHSLCGHGALHFAVITFVCVLMGLISVGSPSCLAVTDGPTLQIDDRNGQIEAPNVTAAPMALLDLHFADGLPNEVAELAASTDDEPDKDGVKTFIPRSALAAFRSPIYPSKSSADRVALVPFRLRAFSSRGSPSA